MVPPDAALNRVLLETPLGDREAVLSDSQPIVLQAGNTLDRAGEPVRSVFFPTSGVVIYVSDMTTGHQAAVTSIGSEGVLGATPLMGIPRHPFRSVALLASEGYRIPIDSVRRAFDECERFRTPMLAALGRQWSEAAGLVACSRAHSHFERLACCLLTTFDKARQTSLLLTHDDLARMVGGARHVVTSALNVLRRDGAIAHARGRIDLISRGLLVRRACECYGQSIDLNGSSALVDR